eukprot:m.1075812 g.1075812  ORF g.1075812 m.1075812 type:complete len:94 (+) comp24245_c0_seq2:3336-3617(+)
MLSSSGIEIDAILLSRLEEEGAGDNFVDEGDTGAEFLFPGDGVRAGFVAVVGDLLALLDFAYIDSRSRLLYEARRDIFDRSLKITRLRTRSPN